MRTVCLGRGPGGARRGPVPVHSFWGLGSRPGGHSGHSWVLEGASVMQMPPCPSQEALLATVAVQVRFCENTHFFIYRVVTYLNIFSGYSNTHL